MIYPGMTPAQGPSRPEFFQLPSDYIFYSLAQRQKAYDVEKKKAEELGDLMDQLDIHEKYFPEYGAKVDEITGMINELSSGKYDLTSPEGQRALGLLRRRTRREFGPDGTFGIMAQATQQYRNEAARIQEMYKDNPRWQQAYIQGLAPADLAPDPNTGLRNLTPTQSLMQAKPFTQEQIQQGASRAIAAVAQSTYAKELGIETPEQLIAVLNNSYVTNVTKQRLQGMLEEYLDANGELTQSRTIENFIDLQNDPNYADATMDELMMEATSRANDDVFRMVNNIAESAAWSRDERKTTVLTGDENGGGSGGPNIPLPTGVQLGADNEKDKELKRREAEQALGLLEIDDKNPFKIPPTQQEYLNLALREVQLHNQGYREIPNYLASTGNIKADYVDPNTGKGYTYDANAATNNDNMFNETLTEKQYDMYVAEYDKKYKAARENYDLAQQTLEENGYQFASEDEAIEFLSTNYQDVNRQWQADLITPASLTNSANSDAFSAALSSIDRAIDIHGDMLVSNPTSYDGDKIKLSDYIQSEMRKNQTTGEAIGAMDLDKKELVAIRADGSLVYKLRVGDSTNKQREIMFTVEPQNRKINTYTAPMRELTKTFYPASKEQKEQVRILLSAGEEIPMQVRPGQITAYVRDDNGQIVPEVLDNPQVSLMYDVEGLDPNSKLGVKLTPQNGSDPIFMPISEYMGQLNQLTEQYIVNYGI